MRHTHKTWMIEDNIPEVAQCDRLGHQLEGVRGVDSHTTPVMEQAIVDGLQRRWYANGCPAFTLTVNTLAAKQTRRGARHD
ncbi:hypothetical protein ACFQO7_26465 [Catellatospora aurea]|uniref:Uncharacterized protein n=2 Tax=Catellatospora aurea TaxID=1337874 RepID=A0ABW2H4W6_9ACTN